MNTRLNGILTTLSQQYAYHLLQQAPNDESRLLFLADGLAHAGFLVIVADLPGNNYDVLLRAWLDGYKRLYTVISSILFPMFTSINVGTADAMRPPVVVIRGESAAVIKTIADYVVPYVAMRQQSNTISDAEIIGLMTYILDELEADELPRRKYDQLLRQSAQIISQLIALPVQQYSLTVMKKPLFQQNSPPPPSQLPNKKARPVPPNTTPEMSQQNPNRDHQPQSDQTRPPKDQDKTQPMPIWFNIDDDIDQTKPQPPVPWTPDEDD